MKTSATCWFPVAVSGAIAAESVGGLVIAGCGSPDRVALSATNVALDTSLTRTVDVGTQVAGRTASPSLVGIQKLIGATPGIYGGRRNQWPGDPAALVDFIENDVAKAAAWASVRGIEPSAIRSYVDGLSWFFVASSAQTTSPLTTAIRS